MTTIEIEVLNVTLHKGHAVLAGQVIGEPDWPQYPLNVPMSREAAIALEPGAKYVLTFEKKAE